MQTPSKLTSISKFLSLVLRHQPEKIGLALDASGWARVDDLLQKMEAAGQPLSREALRELVNASDKKRFALNDDETLIRANQGHSIDVDLDLPVITPPAVLYHGTASRFVESILSGGLDRRARHHVHLTEDVSTALAVGTRYGDPVLLRIDAARMASLGHQFRCSANGVWLVESVPPEFIERVESGTAEARV